MHKMAQIHKFDRTIIKYVFAIKHITYSNIYYSFITLTVNFISQPIHHGI